MSRPGTGKTIAIAVEIRCKSVFTHQQCNKEGTLFGTRRRFVLGHPKHGKHVCTMKEPLASQAIEGFFLFLSRIPNGMTAPDRSPVARSLYQPPPPPPPPPPPEEPSLPEEEPGAVEDDAMDPERSDAKEDANPALKAPAGIDPEYHEGA